MKRLFSVLLCVFLLMSLVVTAYAGNSPEETTAKEIPETPTEVELPASPEDPEPPFFDQYDFETQTGEQFDSVREASAGAPLLGVSSATVNITVQLPEGVTAPAGGGQVRIRVFHECGANQDGVIPMLLNVFSNNRTIAPGDTSVTIPVTVAPGRYAFSVQPMFGAAGLISRETYFNGDGTIAENAYVAQGVSVSVGSVSKTLQLPKAANSISGTINFSKPLASDMTIRAQLREVSYSGTSNSSNISTDITIPAGSTSLSWGFGAPAESYSLQFFNESIYGFADVNGKLSDDYQMRQVFDLASQSYSGLNFNADELVTGDEGNYFLNLTIKLPETLTEYQEYHYYTVIYSSEDGVNSTGTSAREGDSELHVRLRLASGKSYTISYGDMTNAFNLPYGEERGIVPGMRYITAEGGVSSRVADAKSFTLTGDTSFTVDDRDCWVISGTAQRSGVLADATGAGIVTATFSDGQVWGGNAAFWLNSTQANYKIYVPKTQTGTFRLSAFYASEAAGYYAGKMIWTEPTAAQLLDCNISAGTIVLPEPKYISGTLTIPDAAPAPGVAVRLQGTSCTAFAVIPQGSKSISFRMADCYEDAYSVTATGLTGSVRLLNATASGMSGTPCALSMNKLVPVSGKVCLPEGAGDTIVNVQVYSNGSGSNTSTEVTAMGADAAYTLWIPANTQLEIRLYTRYSSSPCISKNTNLYVASDWTVGSSSGGKVSTDAARTGIDFVLPFNVIVSGRFVASGGGTVKTDPKENLYFYFGTEKSGSYFHVNATVDSDGNWIAGIPSDKIGTLYMRFYPDASNNTNMVSYNYFYYSSANKTVTNYNEAEPLTIGKEGLENVALYVDTGWVISGNLLLPEGTEMDLAPQYSYNTFWFRMSAKSEAYNRTYNGGGYMTKGPNSFPYKIVVPKESASYQISFSSMYWNDEAYGTTNIAFDVKVDAPELLNVSGDTAGPDVTVCLTRAKVAFRIARPEEIDNTVNGNIYIKTAEKEYSGNFYINNNQAEYTMSLTIPTDDVSETYQVYYETWSSGLTRKAWLTPTGVSAKEAEAADFPMDGSLSHSFTLLMLQPFIEGKLYFPAEMTNVFKVTLMTTNPIYTNKEFTIDPSACASDSNGKYVPYALYNENGYTGTGFKLYISSLQDESGTLTMSTSNQYWSDDGWTTSNKAQTFAYDGETTTQLDLPLPTWNDGAENYLIQSPHGLKNDSNDVMIFAYTYTYPGECSMLNVHFADRFDGSVMLVDGNGNSYYNVNGGVTVQVSSNSFTITYRLGNTSGVRKYGFAIDSITPVNPSGTDGTGFAAVTANTGDNGVLDTLGSGKSIRAIVVGSEDTTATVCCAVYDENGKMIGLKPVEVALKPEGALVNISFGQKIEDIASVGIFLVNDEVQPLCPAWKS